ncbi:MAG: PP2C family protein-serine/threonine phosphatase [Bacteroidota bacterium]
MKTMNATMHTHSGCLYNSKSLFYKPRVLDNELVAIKTKNNDMQASIRHSRKIQGHIMCGEQNLYRRFPESFLIDKPKDIVSGDFFWLKEIDNKVIVVVGDCTGHGVPAAFVSVLGISFLNQIVIEEKITSPSLILKKLSKMLKKAFHNSDNDITCNDGIDIAVCSIDYNSGLIAFEGALRPAYIISGQQLTILKGSRLSITGNNTDEYKNQLHKFKKGDSLYLFSDGYADQFGGPKNKKLLIKNFQKSLLEGSSYSMTTQMLKLERILIEWKSGMEQTDDIMIAGIKL